MPDDFQKLTRAVDNLTRQLERQARGGGGGGGTATPRGPASAAAAGARAAGGANASAARALAGRALGGLALGAAGAAIAPALEVARAGIGGAITAGVRSGGDGAVAFGGGARAASSAVAALDIFDFTGQKKALRRSDSAAARVKDVARRFAEAGEDIDPANIRAALKFEDARVNRGLEAERLVQNESDKLFPKIAAEEGNAAIERLNSTLQSIESYLRSLTR